MNKKKCPSCKGRGGWFIPSHRPFFLTWFTCGMCGGSGRIDDNESKSEN